MRLVTLETHVVTRRHVRFTNVQNKWVTFSEIDALAFVLDPTELLNATQYLPNAGYYGFGPSGLLNVTSVQHLVNVCMSISG